MQALRRVSRQLLRQDKKVQLLMGTALLCGVAIIFGLYLVLVQDARTKAQWSAGAGTIYFLQSNKQGFKGGVADQFLDKAYKAHLRAVNLSPYDANLWVRFAYVLAARHETVEPALKALDIAQTLNPQDEAQIQTHRNAVMDQFRRFRPGQMNVQPLLDIFDDTLDFKSKQERFE